MRFMVFHHPPDLAKPGFGDFLLLLREYSGLVCPDYHQCRLQRLRLVFDCRH